jgi:general secretion pathway protein J
MCDTIGAASAVPLACPIRRRPHPRSESGRLAGAARSSSRPPPKVRGAAHTVLRSGEAGFTVAELLVSLVILALILSLLPGTLRMGRRVWETDAAFSRHEAAAAFRRAAEERLAGAMPVFVRDPVKGLHVEFQGEPDRVAFVASAPSGPAGGGVYRFELAASGGVMTLRQTLYRQDSGERAPSAIHAAQAKTAGLAFRYFGPPAPDAQPQWSGQWPRRDTLPDLIEITIMPGSGAPVQRSAVAFRLKPGG